MKHDGTRGISRLSMLKLRPRRTAEDPREWKKGLLASLLSGNGGGHEHF